MGNKLKYIAMFAAGAVIGSVATWQFTKKKYEKIAQEEINSVKEVFTINKKELQLYKDLNEKNLEIAKKEEEELSKLKEVITVLDYSTFSENKKEEKKVVIDTGPYVISPDEFGEEDDYECYTLIYYADGFLTDDDDELIDDIESMIGYESLKHFGEYEDDSVFVRNEERKCDYEILKDMRNYIDIVNKRGFS